MTDGLVKPLSDPVSRMVWALVALVKRVERGSFERSPQPLASCRRATILPRLRVVPERFIGSIAISSTRPLELSSGWWLLLLSRDQGPRERFPTQARVPK